MEKNKKLWIVIGIIVVVGIIIIALASSKKGGSPMNGNPADNAPATSQTDGSNTGNSQPIEPTIISSSSVASLEGARIELPGASPISKDNKVLTAEGKVTENNVVPGSPNAPQQTSPVAKEQLPASVLKLDVSAAGFSPSEFTVKAGSAVTIALSSVDSYTHVFMFDDPSLSAVAIGVGPKETRAITFNAPKAGEYSFRCDVPGHAARGEVGKMIVK